MFHHDGGLGGTAQLKPRPLAQTSGRWQRRFGSSAGAEAVSLVPCGLCFWSPCDGRCASFSSSLSECSPPLGTPFPPPPPLWPSWGIPPPLLQIALLPPPPLPPGPQSPPPPHHHQRPPRKSLSRSHQLSPFGGMQSEGSIDCPPSPRRLKTRPPKETDPEQFLESSAPQVSGVSAGQMCKMEQETNGATMCKEAAKHDKKSILNQREEWNVCVGTHSPPS